MGKNWAGPFFPPSKMLGSFYLSSRLLDYVILLLYLNSLDLYQTENQVFQTNTFICNCRVGKDWAGPFYPPSLIFRSSIDRFVFWFMLLFHSILTFMKDLYQVRIKFSIQQDYWYFYIVGWGKSGPANSFPPPPLHNAWIFQFIV